MWNKLKNWQKSIIILLAFIIIFYILGKLFVPIDLIGQTYIYPPIIYAIFIVLPILVIRYSDKKALKILASIILGICLLIILVPLLQMIWDYLSGSIYSPLSDNPLATIFSFLYLQPLKWRFITLLILFGGTM